MADEVMERRRAIRSAASPRVRLYDLEGLTALFPREQRAMRDIVRLPGFPAPLNLPGHPMWREVDVERWIESLA